MMNTWGMTDVGLVRKDNQDAYAMTEHPASGHTICVVCDGPITSARWASSG